jgi:hypothetical protein
MAKIQQNILNDPSIVLPEQRRLALQQVRERVASLHGERLWPPANCERFRFGAFLG